MIQFLFFVQYNAYNFIDGIDANIHLETIKNQALILFFSIQSNYFNLILFTLIIISVTLFFNLQKRGKYSWEILEV